MFRPLIKTLAPCLLLIAYCSFLTEGQTTNATLSGLVEDEQGSAIPGCKVTVSNEATGLRRSATTDESGLWTVPLLPPATYTVTAEANGFKRIQFPNIVLNVN